MCNNRQLNYVKFLFSFKKPQKITQIDETIEFNS